ncbi:MAG: hypothetical protein ACREKL_13370 [Chthoniobacterales bacterium]
MAKASRNLLSGEDILRFLRSFEGAAATFDRSDERWTLWLPEMTAGDHPLTPASQVFFPVILRHGPQAIAIRFLYDCSSGKVRYYTSAIPQEIAGLKEFENAVSELFRHSLPVEPMRERKLGRGLSIRSRKPEKLTTPRPAGDESLAEPVQSGAAALVPVAPMSPTVIVAPVAAEEAVVALPAAAPIEVKRTVRVEIGPRVRAVLMAFIVTVGIVALVGLAIYGYLQATQDPGVLHHKMMLEEMQMQK